MLIDIKCPHCRDTIPITESAGEQAVDCPGCGERFTVPAAGGTSPKPATDDKKPAAAKGKKPARRPARRRDDDDDDDDDRPRRRDTGGSKGGMVGIIVAGGIGLVVLAGGFGLAAWLIFSKDDPAAANQPDDKKAPDIRPAAGAGLPKGVPGRNPGESVAPPARPEPKNPGPPPASAAPAITLPAPADGVCVGRGGKYLFLHLKSARQMAVLDLAAGKVTKYLPVADDDVVFAAGLNHLVLGYPKQQVLQRYALATLEKDLSAPFQSKWPLRGLGMGAASNGPLLVAAGEFPHGSELFLIDVLTMRRAVGSEIKNSNFWPEAGMRVWAAQDGRTFAAKAGGLGRPTVFQVRPTGWGVHPSPCDPPMLGADGERVVGNGMIARPDGKEVGERKHGVWYVPAAEGPFFLSLSEQKVGTWPTERKYPELQVHAAPGQGPVFTYPELPETQGFIDPFQEPHKALDRYVFFLPFTNVLAILPAARDRVYLRKVDLKGSLAKAAVDYLVVVSRPPVARKGQEFRYVPDVWTKRGGAKLSLDAGPEGMKVEGGAVVWAVPADYPDPSANVILGVTDAGGQATFHTFDLPVFPAQ
ncbi:MAG: hypothetical protein JWO38_4203 [Gemmataceae bacterium]|nr:hypothetical protein [Gemmataceae bacterium]